MTLMERVCASPKIGKGLNSYTSPATEQTLRLRRRPFGTANGASQTRKLFGNQPRALLPIPTVFDLYNHFTKGVDNAD